MYPQLSYVEVGVCKCYAAWMTIQQPQHNIVRPLSQDTWKWVYASVVMEVGTCKCCHATWRAIEEHTVCIFLNAKQLLHSLVALVRLLSMVVACEWKGEKWHRIIPLRDSASASPVVTIWGSTPTTSLSSKVTCHMVDSEVTCYTVMNSEVTCHMVTDSAVSVTRWWAVKWHVTWWWTVKWHTML